MHVTCLGFWKFTAGLWPKVAGGQCESPFSSFTSCETVGLILPDLSFPICKIKENKYIHLTELLLGLNEVINKKPGTE